MQHSPGFLMVVNEARTRVQEVEVDEAKSRLASNPTAILMDVREDSEWQAGHARGAVHLGRGVLERDLEKLVPNVDTEILMYCGGGYRSVLACDAAQRMGYRKVVSVIGGHRAMVLQGWPMLSG